MIPESTHPKYYSKHTKMSVDPFYNFLHTKKLGINHPSNSLTMPCTRNSPAFESLPWRLMWSDQPWRHLHQKFWLPSTQPAGTCTIAVSFPAHSWRLSTQPFPPIISQYPTIAFENGSRQFSSHSPRLPKVFLSRFSTSGTRYHARLWKCPVSI